MAQLLEQFDARQVAPSAFPPPPPLAKYHVAIVETDVKAANTGNGGLLEMVLKIGDSGPQMDRRITYRLNLYNTNEQARAIARGEFSAICHALGMSAVPIQDTRQLHDIWFMASIGPQTKDPRYAEVFEVFDVQGNQPWKPAAGQAPAPTAFNVPPAPPQAPPVAQWGQPQPPAPPVQSQSGNPWGPPAPAAPGGWSPQPPAQQAQPPAQQWGQPQAAAPPATPPVWPGTGGSAAPPAQAPWVK